MQAEARAVAMVAGPPTDADGSARSDPAAVPPYPGRPRGARRGLVADLAIEAKRRASLAWRTSAFAAWRLAAASAPRIGQLPPRSGPAGDEHATGLYSGSIELAGHRVETAGLSPFDLSARDGIDPAWLAALHGFGWMDGAIASGTPVARTHAATMVADWLTRFGRARRGLPWQVDVVSQRLLAWLRAHEVLVLEPSDARPGGEGPSHDLLRQALARHIRFLSVAGPAAPDGTVRLHAAVAAAAGAVACGLPPRAVGALNGRLSQELVRQTGAGGLPLDRRIDTSVRLLDDLVALREVCSLERVAPPRELSPAIDRMARTLEALSPGGMPARFHGSSSAAAGSAAGLRAVLAAASESARPAWRRDGAHLYGHMAALRQGDTHLVIDVGTAVTAAARRNGHAAPVAFEMWSGDAPIIVNCGVPTTEATRYRPFTFATAAHSTASFDGADASALLNSLAARWLGQRLSGRQPEVTAQLLRDGGWEAVRAVHDAWAVRFGRLHERTLTLSPDGERVMGVDRFPAAPGATPGRDSSIAVRFHLPVGAGASMLSRPGRALIVAGDAPAFTFACEGAELEIAESVIFDGADGPRRSRQIVLHARAPGGLEAGGTVPEIRWSLTRQEGGEGSGTARAARTRKGEARREEETAMDDLLAPLE